MPYKAVIFDLDGTLINSLEDLADSANALLRDCGKPTHATEEYRYLVGNGSRRLIERILPGEPPAAIDAALEKYKGIYAQHYLDKTRSYPGILELLAELRSREIPLAVCTNKHVLAVSSIVNVLFEPDTFQQVIGDQPGMTCKPDPGSVLKIIQNFGVAPEETVYLGDSMVDMQTAVNAGAFPVGVLWGFREADELLANGAQLLLQQPADLLEKVEFISTQNCEVSI